MKKNDWNPQVLDGDATAATLPVPPPPPQDADFDTVRFRPTARPNQRPAPMLATKPVSSESGPNPAIQAVNDAVQEASMWVRPLQQEIGRVIVGQKHLIDRLTATSTRHTPWHVVPADDKKNARLIVSQIVLDALKDLKMAYPKSTAKRRRELKAIRKQL